MDDKIRYKTIDDNGPLKIDKDLFELQKIIIYFGKVKLEEVRLLRDIIKSQKEKESSKDIQIEEETKIDSICSHISKIKIPEGYGGNNLK